MCKGLKKLASNHVFEVQMIRIKLGTCANYQRKKNVLVLVNGEQKIPDLL